MGSVGSSSHLVAYALRRHDAYRIDGIAEGADYAQYEDEEQERQTEPEENPNARHPASVSGLRESDNNGDIRCGWKEEEGQAVQTCAGDHGGFNVLTCAC